MAQTAGAEYGATFTAVGAIRARNPAVEVLRVTAFFEGKEIANSALIAVVPGAPVAAYTVGGGPKGACGLTLADFSAGARTLSPDSLAARYSARLAGNRQHEKLTYTLREARESREEDVEQFSAFCFTPAVQSSLGGYMAALKARSKPSK